MTPAGTLSIQLVDANPYEFSEDQLVGVINNSPGAVASITLSGSDIFGFDGDGICSGGFISASFCTSADSSGYGPNGVTFSVVDADNGTVFFSPGIPGGGTGFFSLESAPVVGGGGIIIGGVPEPATFALLGTGLTGLAVFARRRRKARL